MRRAHHGGTARRQDQGSVPVRQISYPGNDTIVLMLVRPLQGPAYVDGAPGLNPPPVPMDMERLLPILAFYGVPVAGRYPGM